jgi:hypothetical protein
MLAKDDLKDGLTGLVPQALSAVAKTGLFCVSRIDSTASTFFLTMLETILEHKRNK